MYPKIDECDKCRYLIQEKEKLNTMFYFLFSLNFDFILSLLLL